MILSEFELKVDVTTEAKLGPDGAREPDKGKGKGGDPNNPNGKGKGKSKKGDQGNDSSLKSISPSDKNLTNHQKKELKRLQITRSELPVKGGMGKGKGKGGKSDETRYTNAAECTNFKKDDGCPYGKACIFFHPPATKDQCSICGSKLHHAKDCTRK